LHSQFNDAGLETGIPCNTTRCWAVAPGIIVRASDRGRPAIRYRL